MKRILSFLLWIPLSASAIGQSVPAPPITTSQVNLPVFTLNPAPANGASLALVGNPGHQTIYYWIVAEYSVGQASPAGPYVISNARDTLSNTAYVTIAPQFGSTPVSYDVLKTSTRTQPTGACNCAVATNVSPGTIANDQSNSTSSYTVNPIAINGLALTLTNEVQSAGVSHLILRQNGAFVADLSTATAGVTGGGNANIVPIWTGTTALGNSGISWTVQGGGVALTKIKTDSVEAGFAFTSNGAVDTTATAFNDVELGNGTFMAYEYGETPVGSTSFACPNDAGAVPALYWNLAATTPASALTICSPSNGGWISLLSASNLINNLNITNFNGGTGASSSTYWRGDGTWATPSGGGSVSVGLTVNTSSPCGAIAITGSPVSSSGTLNMNWTGVSGDILTFNGSNCPIDSGTLLTALAPKASPSFSGTVTLPDGSTCSSSLCAFANGVTAPSFSANNDGVHAGYTSWVGNTANPSIPANQFAIGGFTSAGATAYGIQFPNSAPSGGQCPSWPTPTSGWSQASWITCGAQVSVANSWTAPQTFTNGIVNTTTPIRDQTRFVLAANMTAVATAGVNIGSTGSGNTTFSWPVTSANWYDLECKLPVTFASSATIRFELVSISGGVTISNVNAETLGNTGASAAFQDLATIAGTSLAGSETPVTGAPAASEMVTYDSQFLTSHGGNIGLEFVANGTNNVTMLLGGECGLTQIN